MSKPDRFERWYRRAEQPCAKRGTVEFDFLRYGFAIGLAAAKADLRREQRKNSFVTVKGQSI